MSTAESIMVGMRLRPLVGKQEQGQTHCIKIEDQHTVAIIDSAGDSELRKEFAVDVAMDSTDPKDPDFVSQERCYELMGKRMLEHMLQGYNTCLFCYGQTGTGKTTTIMGKASPPSEQGLLMRLISDIFRDVESLRSDGYQVHVKVQMLEVYNERLNDLIADRQGPDTSRRKIDVHVHPELGVYLTGATEAPVETFQDCITLIEYGNTMKTVHATAMNQQSSRGHTVFKLRMEKKGGHDNMVISSEVYFADLAGRENEKTTQVKGDRLVELSFINRSLMWLTTCIQSLGNDSRAGPMMDKRKTCAGLDKLPASNSSGNVSARMPTMTRARTMRGPSDQGMAKFRNSKLTLLLSNALSGNSRTAMIGTLSPAVANFEESYSTLKFASAVKNIKLTAKAATAVDKESLVKKLQQEVMELKKQLTKAKAAKTDMDSDESEVENAEVEDLSNKLLAAEAIFNTEAKDWGEFKEEEGKIRLNRLQTMEKLGAGKRSGGAKTSQIFPYLANYSEDPHLAFTLVFYVPPDGKDYSAGSSDSCDFTLPFGLGVTDTTCHLRNQDKRLLIRAARAPFVGLAKVEVNCVSLGEEPQALKNLDCILFGRSTTFFAFLTHTSSEEVSAKIWSIFHQMEEVLGSDDTFSGILGDDRYSDPVALELARQYYMMLEKQNMSTEGAMILRRYLHSARNARKQVEEANDITKSVRPSSGLRFDLVAEAPVMSFGFGAANVPELCVRLVRRNARTNWRQARQRTSLVNSEGAPTLLGVVKELMNPEAISHGGTELLSVWTWPKFMARLELMHQEYDAWTADPKGYQVNPLADPWAEYGPGEMLELQTHAEEEREKVREREQFKYQEELKQRKVREERLEAENRSMQKEMQDMRVELSRLRMKATTPNSAMPEIGGELDKSQAAYLESEQVKRCLNLASGNRELLNKLMGGKSSSGGEKKDGADHHSSGRSSRLSPPAHSATQAMPRASSYNPSDRSKTVQLTTEVRPLSRSPRERPEAKKIQTVSPRPVEKG